MPWSVPPGNPVTPRASRFAKALRRTQIEPEKKLWWHLRNRLPIEGSHFRRQVPIEGYVVDFCCLRCRVIIELDGEQHGVDRQAAYDLRRTAVLERYGYRILRFPNDAVMRQIDTVLDTIFAALATSPTERRAGGTTPTPGPSPQGGGEQEP